MMNSSKNMPDFLIIGAGKSGTTSVDNYLKQHPEIFMSSVKEPNFFAYELTDTADLKALPEELKHYEKSVTSLNDYYDLFKESDPGQLKGETSNTYLYGKDAPERIYHHIPGVKLIAILRQPAYRLYSRYLHLARDNRLPSPKFGDCLNKESIWWERNDLINEGFYYKHLNRFYELFPQENIKVFLYEDLKSNLNLLLKDIFTFLGVDNTFECNLSVKYNESGIIKNKLIHRVIGGNGVVQSVVKKVTPTLYDNAKNSIFAQKIINQLRSKNLEKPKIEQRIEQYLTHEVYKADIIKLQSLINRDLTSWLK